jgi:hypothetical protein
MKKTKKPIKYYLLLLTLSFVVMGLSIIYKAFTSAVQTSDFVYLFIIPLLFTGVYWGVDTLAVKFSEKKAKKDYEGQFLEVVADRMRESKAFLIEDFRHLQNSQKFQETMRTAFLITQKGEDENRTIERLEKKFEKRTIEYKAMQYVIPVVKQKLEEKVK